ncbi:unnamed protein product [Boreogadus saida]
MLVVEEELVVEEVKVVELSPSSSPLPEEKRILGWTERGRLITRSRVAPPPSQREGPHQPLPLLSAHISPLRLFHPRGGPPGGQRGPLEPIDRPLSTGARRTRGVTSSSRQEAEDASQCGRISIHHVPGRVPLALAVKASRNRKVTVGEGGETSCLQRDPLRNLLVRWATGPLNGPPHPVGYRSTEGPCQAPGGQQMGPRGL